MTRVLALALVATLSVGCTEDTPGYCKDDSQCQDKSWEHHEPGKPRCHPITHRCVAATPDGGVDAGLDGPGPDGDTRLELGDDCTDGDQCKSGNCTDDVCCEDKACSGKCVACNVKGFRGKCNLVPDGDPHEDDCKGSVAGGLCDGVCNGSGKCRFPGAEKTGCASKTCSDGEETTHVCDGNGGCTTNKTYCNGFVCDGDSCKTSCTTTATDCMPTFNCNTASSKCEANKGPGEKCGTNDDACASKNCVDGVCCKTKPCGTCQTCNGTNPGTCTDIPAGGAAPTGQCLGDASCGAGKCDGSGKCAYTATGTKCAADKCTPSTDKITKSACNASHKCVAGTATACPNYLQCASTNACKTGCVDHTTDCVTNSVCDRENAHVNGMGVCVDPNDVLWISPGDNIATKIGTATTKVVAVKPATYSQPVTITGKTIKIIGTGTAANPSKLQTVASAGPAITVTNGAEVTIQGLRIEKAQNEGVFCQGTSSNKSDVTVVESTVFDNDSTGVAASYCDVTLRRNKIQNNQGGGAKLSDGTFTVVNNLVTGNGTVPSSTVGGFKLDPSQVAGNIFVNNTVAHNGGSHLPAGGAVQCQPGSAFDLYNSIFYGNGSNPVDDCTPKYSDLEGGTGNGNISANPLFVSLVKSDFSLQPTSPCIDKGADTVPGVTLPAIDIANKPRKVDKIAGGVKVDMGAYEVQ